MRSCAILLATLLLTSCSLFQGGEWPEGAQPREYFLGHYQADVENQAFQTRENYLSWVNSFYNGLDPVPGWLEMSNQVLAELDQAQRAEVEPRLFELGGLIGAEWAKDNATRVLSTRMANIWRDALIEALARNDINNFLNRLEADVEALLAGELDGEDIYFERYYVDEFDF